MMPKLILFNGPPFCGKDTAATLTLGLMQDQGHYATLIKFSAPIKTALASFLSLTDSEYERYFETPDKDIPSVLFGGRTPRAALIDLSERWAKELYSKDVFGWLAIRQMERCHDVDTFIFSDSGFQSEFDYLYSRHDPASMLVFQMYRKDCSFEGDSRNYIDTRDAPIIMLTNNGSLDSLHASLTAALGFV